MPLFQENQVPLPLKNHQNFKGPLIGRNHNIALSIICNLACEGSS